VPLATTFDATALSRVARVVIMAEESPFGHDRLAAASLHAHRCAELDNSKPTRVEAGGTPQRRFGRRTHAVSPFAMMPLVNIGISMQG